MALASSAKEFVDSFGQTTNKISEGIPAPTPTEAFWVLLGVALIVAAALVVGVVLLGTAIIYAIHNGYDDVGFEVGVNSGDDGTGFSVGIKFTEVVLQR